MFNKTNKTMKSIKFFAMTGLVAFLGVTALTSCEGNNNPDGQETGKYNGETVKTEFLINIPLANDGGSVRHMPSTSIPGPGAFKGMDEIVLMPFETNTVSSPSTHTEAVVGTSSRIGSYISLTSFSAFEHALNNSTSSAKLYDDISIPLGTNHFLFYAHSSGPTSGDPATAVAQGSYSVDQSFQYGRLTPNDLSQSTPSSYTFSLVQIYDGSANEVASKLVDWLTHIANATDGTANWAAGGATANQGYIDMYTIFTGLQAGSSASVKEVIEDLYNTLYPRYSDNNLVKAIVDSITAYKPDGENTYTNTITGTVPNATLSLNEAFTGFPANINLPDGAAAVAWNDTDKKFEITTTNPAWAATNTGASGSSTISVPNSSKFVYPAAVYFYGNSGLKTSTSKQGSNYSNYQSWKDILDNLYSGTTNLSVSSNTRSVAIADSIQYGVAKLVTKVTAGGTTINDGASPATAVTASNITMTAVLVGTQGQVGFNFTPATAGDLIIYDKELSSGTYTLGTTATQENPTIVLETPSETNVMIAVEFLNGDQDFIGRGGQLIAKNTKFYMVAELKAEEATETGSCVFKQDYTTTVNLSLGSLQHAYNVIPDLRSNNLELGFSVDLSWQSGHVFNVTL